MKVLVALNHPAHYYLFKFIVKELQKKGHEVRFVIKDKDLLKKILVREGIPYTKLITRKTGKFGKISTISNLCIEMIFQDISLKKYLKTFWPDIMIGTDISISHIGLLKKNSLYSI